MQSVSLSLFRFGPAAARAWAFAQMGPARFAIARAPGIGFFKLCGSGTGEGFTPVPNTAVYAILATWPDTETGRQALATERVFRRYAAMSEEQCTWHLAASSARGQWSGQAPFEAEAPPPLGPVAALTRATIKPRKVLKFWGQGPAVSDLIGANTDVVFKIGIGELPWFQQVTFSVWPSTRSMDRFARVSGAHAEAIRAVREGGWFAEELYARFAITAVDGTWEGRDMAQELELAA